MNPAPTPNAIETRPCREPRGVTTGIARQRDWLQEARR